MSLTSTKEVWKVCAGCGIEKPLVNFHKAVRGKYGRNSKCRKCISKYNKERPADLTDVRRKGRLRAYNLTPEKFTAMLEAQGGKCAICGTTEPGGRHNQWHVDHDHDCCDGSRSCGECLRGILCHRCNRGLGLFSDDADRLTSAMAYLLRWDSCEYVTGVE